MPVPVVERIPQQLDISPDMTQHSVVQSRTTRSYLPTSGQSFTYSGNNIIELVVSDANYLDLQTIGLHYNVVVSGVTGGQLTCLENGYSPFYKYELLINGVLVSTATDIGQVVGQVVAATCPREYYGTAMSRAGFWLDDYSLRLNGADGLAQTFAAKAGIISAQQQSASGFDVFIDLMPLIRMFSETQTYFPARNVSNMTIRLYLQPNASALVNLTGATQAGAISADATGSYTLSQVKLNVDSVALSPTFVSAFDSYIEKSSADPAGGLNLLFSDITSQRALIASGSQVDILLSKACKYLKSVFASQHRTSELNSIVAVKTERQKFCNLTSFQVNVGGAFYPMDKPLTRAQVQYENDKAWNKSYDILAGGLQSYTNSVGFTASYANVNDNTAITPGANWATIPDMENGFLNHSVVGVNMEQVLVHGSGALVGISLTGGAPAIVRLYYESGTPSDGNHSLVAVLYFNKVVKVRYNQVEVIE
jgi:hypothetical protein